MATRASRTAPAAQAETVTPEPAPAGEPVHGRAPVGADLPAAWGTEKIEDFNGHNPTDKADLIGVPFLVIGAEIERNDNRGYDTAWVYALDTNGTEFEFSDASSGVREQIQALLLAQGLDPAPGSGYQAFSPRIVVRRGLRASTFRIQDPERAGKFREATTYYLTASGRTHN